MMDKEERAYLRAAKALSAKLSTRHARDSVKPAARLWTKRSEVKREVDFAALTLQWYLGVYRGRGA
jgi:hypothetical protein